jgi:aminopeptidase N
MPPPTETPLALVLETPTPLELATPTPPPPRTRYILDTTINYNAHTVSVDQTIFFANLTAVELEALVLAVVPNLWRGAFKLESIRVDGQPVQSYTVSGQRLDLTLPSPLAVSNVVEIQLEYSLALPFAEQQDPSIARPRIFGYTNRQINLTNWYPYVVPYINGGWILHDPWAYGEHLVYEAADFEVTVRFTDPASAPIVAASGAPEQIGDATRYTITSARTFALAASREFQVASMQVGDVALSSYYFPFFERGGQAALQATAEAVQVFSQRFGEYPHKSLAIVMGDFNDGMEYSAFFYLPRDFYNLYDGTPANYLTFVTVHETAHQWWFEQVASDQAMQPWLDETLATYSERIYYESVHPDLVNWWWGYRIDFYKPEGFADITIYEGQGFRPYTNATYFQGAYFLEKLRQRIGDEAFFAFLQSYLNRGRGRIVTADEFFQVLRLHTSADYSDLVSQYFRGSYP